MNRQELLREYLNHVDDDPRGVMHHRKITFIKDKDGKTVEIETHEELWFD
jgi:hypothetical protein